jgi:HSP20 family protein
LIFLRIIIKIGRSLKSGDGAEDVLGVRKMLGLKKWDPLYELGTFHRDIDEFFRRTFGSIAPGIFRGEWYPAVESYMEKDKFLVKLDLPGIDPKDVDISVIGNQLTIKGERKLGKEFKEAEKYFCEVCYGSFERTLTLPEGVDLGNIHAGYHEGILEISMPAKGVALPKKISVEVEGVKRKAA